MESTIEYLFLAYYCTRRYIIRAPGSFFIFPCRSLRHIRMIHCVPVRNGDAIGVRSPRMLKITKKHLAMVRTCFISTSRVRTREQIKTHVHRCACFMRFYLSCYRTYLFFNRKLLVARKTNCSNAFAFRGNE